MITIKFLLIAGSLLALAIVLLIAVVSFDFPTRVPERYIDEEYGVVCYQARGSIDCVSIDTEGGFQP